MIQTPFHLAKEEEVRALGIQPPAVHSDYSGALGELNALRKNLRSLMVMLETCTKCGACATACHSYLGTGDYHNIPAARADLFRQIYKRYFTFSGRLLGRFCGAQDFDEETLGKWMTYFYQCNECRRCSQFCPFGIDTAEITIAARHILSRLGIMPRFMQQIGANMDKTGNNMGITKPALIDTCEFFEDELKEETGLDIKIPVDKPQSDILYIPSSADFFTNFDTMSGAAKLFHCLGVNWTISSKVLEAANFGLLFDYDVMKEHNSRMRKAAAELGATTVIQGECGHGWRAARMYSEGANGPVPFRLLHIHDYTVEHLHELTLQKLPLRVTLHDPCNYVRAGGIIEQPRKIIRASVTDFVEMTPNREQNFCCGGGSGILMDEVMELRMKLGKKKAEQVKNVGNIDYLAAPCSICKAQLPVVMKHYGMGDLAIGGVMDLLGKAIVLKNM